MGHTLVLIATILCALSPSPMQIDHCCISTVCRTNHRTTRQQEKLFPSYQVTMWKWNWLSLQQTGTQWAPSSQLFPREQLIFCSNLVSQSFWWNTMNCNIMKFKKPRGSQKLPTRLTMLQFVHLSTLTKQAISSRMIANWSVGPSHWTPRTFCSPECSFWELWSVAFVHMSSDSCIHMVK